MMKNHSFKNAFALLVLAFAAMPLAAACSSTTTSGSNTSTSSAGTKVTTRISAASGGTVADKEGKATLTIPGGALPGDIDITLEVGAASNGSAAPVYDFGPDGTKFSKPATLVLKADGLTVPEGKRAALAVFEGSAWKEIEGSSLANGVVTGAVSHFSKFSIILVDGKAVLVSSCGDAVSKFAACGGNVKGTWVFQNWCFKSQKVGSDPFNGKCPGANMGIDLTVQGDITFDDTTATMSALTSNQKMTLNVPTSCVGGSCTELQKSLSKDNPSGTTCTVAADVCKCTSEQTKTEPAGAPKPYTVSGNTITIGSSDSSAKPAEYCVSGNTLQVRSDIGTNEETIIVLTKKP